MWEWVVNSSSVCLFSHGFMTIREVNLISLISALSGKLYGNWIRCGRKGEGGGYGGED